jgi:hypothetical protein
MASRSGQMKPLFKKARKQGHDSEVLKRVTSKDQGEADRPGIGQGDEDVDEGAGVIALRLMWFETKGVLGAKLPSAD